MKQLSLVINIRLNEAENTAAEIYTIREGYRVVAVRGSVIFSVISSLSFIDPMYQFSLQKFMEQMSEILRKREKRDGLIDRLLLLTSDITTSLYNIICPGLFEKHKLLYSFMTAVKISIAANVISETEWHYFTDSVLPYISSSDNPPLPGHLRAYGLCEKSWTSALMLAYNMPVAFKGLIDDLKNIERCSEWARFFQSDSYHTHDLPVEWESRLSCFHRLLLIKTIKEEQIVFAMKKYITDNIGESFCESPLSDVDDVYNVSTAVTPLIVILSPGENPIDSILQLAEKKGQSGKRLRIISMGQDQDHRAEKAIEEARLLGGWVYLQNCHLSLSWLPKLEEIVDKMQKDPGSVNSNHRLWISSMSTTHFPVSVLQCGVKIAVETPKGIKSHMMRTFQSISEEEYNSCTRKELYKKFLFTTAFFHALIFERKKYGALGWNVPYNWMNSDLKSALVQVKMNLETQDSIPWETLIFNLSEVTYGGRVTDVLDKRTISAILRKYYSPSLLDESFTFTEDGIYYPPICSDLSGVREYIQQLPSEDDLDISLLGLHPNAVISHQQRESRAFLSAGEEPSYFF